ncbi:MAG: phosphoserine phosphatase SerB [Gammaproteobacteria bacterium]
MKLAILDFDSTLMDGETIDILAEQVGVKEQVEKLTDAAMQGELDFFESLTQRASLLKGMDASIVDYVCHQLPLMPGAKEFVAELKRQDYKVAVFSGGFRNATNYYKKVLGYDTEFSNILHHVGGRLTGKVGGDVMFDFSKGDLLLRLQNLLGISEQNTLVCGDGANDLSMFEHADTRIAFCARPVLKQKANIVIEDKDLRAIIPLL